MGRDPARAAVWVAALAGLVPVAAPTVASAQAQEAIERGHSEIEAGRDLLGCFRTYLRDAPRAPGADTRLRACAASAHGHVTKVSVTAIRERARCLAAAIARVASVLHRAENGAVTEALDEARAALAECAAERDPREARL